MKPGSGRSNAMTTRREYTGAGPRLGGRRGIGLVAPGAALARPNIADIRGHAPSRRRWLSLCATALLVLSACSDAADRARVPVFAASSLTEAFTALEAQFERAHPSDDVQLTFAGSQVLRLQIEQGAPAQVFASANPAHMTALTAAGVVPRSAPFAHNRLTIIVPTDNPANVTRFANLARARRLVIGNAQSPIGQYTRAVFRKAATRSGAAVAGQPRAVSEESNVRLVRAKVELGEADAAIVYRSDARAAGPGRVRMVPIPADLNVAAEYRIGAVRSASAGAARFVDFVRSPAGQRIMAQHGFDAVEP